MPRSVWEGEGETPAATSAPIDFDALRTARGERGRFTTGVPGPALKDGQRSRLLLAQPDIAALHQAEINRKLQDLGGEANVSANELAMVRELARLEIIAESLGQNIFQHDAMTTKGNTRAATLTYLSVLDRMQRLAVTLGLKRRAQRVPSLADYLQQQKPAATSPAAEEPSCETQ